MKPVIMISIKPKYVKEILNGNKTIEIRKRFPKDFVGWVYIYCTKTLPHLSKTYVGDYEVYDDTQWDKEWLDLNGKVVARFWCDKVDCYEDVCFWSEENEKASCATASEFFDYMHHIKCHRSCCLIHISKLEIFNKPKIIREFKKPMEYTKHCNRDCNNCDYAGFNDKTNKWEYECTLFKAPQNWCYVEDNL